MLGTTTWLPPLRSVIHSDDGEGCDSSGGYNNDCYYVASAAAAAAAAASDNDTDDCDCDASEDDYDNDVNNYENIQS